jgi:phage-related minor tail protein
MPDMATLTITETQQLHNAMARVQSVANKLNEVAETAEPEMKKELEGMVNALKKAHSDIKVVWTMKGHYDS